MTRILSAAAVALLLPFATFAQVDAHEQLRQAIDANPAYQAMNIDVDALTDEQVGLVYAVLIDSNLTETEQQEQIGTIIGN